MAILLLILPFTITAAAASPAEGANQCPLWFKWINTSSSAGYCACDVKAARCIHCNQINQMTSLSQSCCTFHDSRENKTGVYLCYFLLPAELPLPAKVSELNSVVCGNFSREVKGPLCGRCINNTGPSVYSVGSRCVPCSPVNILYYILLQYLPSTVVFLLVVIFRPSITSAPMANYILYCNLTMLCYRYVLWAYVRLDTIIGKATLTLSAIWSFDALLFISPPLCISEHMQEFYTPFLNFIATMYPFILLILTYGVMKLHKRNFKPVVVLWRAFARIFVQFYRAWDPRSSMIQAFASLFFLSYAKLTFLIWEGVMYTTEMNNKGINVLYIDPNVPFLSWRHIMLIVFSLAVAVFVFLPPLLIQVVYPTSLYRKLSHWISPKWRPRIKTYTEAFQCCLKDGKNGTRDYRSLSGWIFLLSGFFPQLLVVIIAIAIPGS